LTEKTKALKSGRHQYQIFNAGYIGTLKYRWIPWLWAKTAKDLERQPRRFLRLVASLVRDIGPVISGISTPRNKKRGRTYKFVIP